ncbi:MAG: phosphatidylserine decarboxylase [Pseudohongiellaceae bacterium]|jgi:phosphatidylserine decarboxylase
MKTQKKRDNTNTWIQRFSNLETLNFMLTNRIPRNLSTQIMGRVSRIQNPLMTRFSIGVWKFFADDLRLDEALSDHYKSLHECFIRELKADARPINQHKNILTSPCDAVIGAFGKINDTELYQIKGFPYSLKDLLGNHLDLNKYRNGRFITLRIKSSMYHRFHAPIACKLKQIHYIAGDTWNVNPVALQRVEKLFCKNERAVLDLALAENQGAIALVPVAAILVASMKFHCLDDTLDMHFKGPNTLNCNARYNKGDQMGYFQHGSTIVMLCSDNYHFLPTLKQGSIIRVGEAVMSMDQEAPETP